MAFLYTTVMYPANSAVYDTGLRKFTTGLLFLYNCETLSLTQTKEQILTVLL